MSDGQRAKGDKKGGSGGQAQKEGHWSRALVDMLRN